MHNHVDPVNDIETINLELIISDLEIVDNRINKIKRKYESGDRTVVVEYELLTKIKNSWA